MQIAQSFMFLLVCSFKIVNGDEETESTTVLSTSQENNDLRTSIVSQGGREIKSELSGCSLRICGYQNLASRLAKSVSGLKGCSADTKDCKDLKDVSKTHEGDFAEDQKGLNGSEPTGERGGLKGVEEPIRIPGPQGIPGLVGSKGEKGLDGVKGASGERGSKGEQGDKGLDGNNSPKGDKGDKGPTGPPGPPGDKGEKGDRGLNGIGIQGEKGVKGESGAPGRNCEKDLTRSESHALDVGKLSNPAISCLHIDSRDDGDYFLNPTDKFSAQCDFTNNRVCYPKPSTTKNIKYNFISQPFWLSKTGFKIENLYGNIFPRIEYLRKITSYATQKIRVYCHNTYVVPTSESDKEKFLQILLWNDVLIGPEPTDRTPLSYTVIDDQCNTPDGGYADIEISTYATRLPIVDFYIRDIRKLDQAISVEFLELCFTFNPTYDD